ncbi:MAG: hypothetical protein AB1704_27960 [Pseudomonadota bacterium]|jgi:hypothetical protein|uniref:hypothetical protein n=1 Tax=Burkholderiaceae TaxID=119060 RepID=UPI0010F9908E|nr:hypothetical protein [Burkholderia sp. 4M9327F10]
MRAYIRLCFQILRYLPVVVAICIGGIQSAHADCASTSANLPLNLTLPPTNIAVSPNLPLGATLGSAHVAALQDIPFVCNGKSNAREVRLVTPPVPVADFANVYRTNIPGIGMRITASGGSFAGIDDGPRLAPYNIPLQQQANHLTGFALQVDFIKIGEVQNGTLAAGKLVTVFVGGAELIDVAIPNSAVLFVANQCDAVHVGGAVATGIGTAGAFSYESIAVGTGCNPGVGVVLQLDQGYVYGRGAPLITQDVHRKAATVPDLAVANHAQLSYRNPNAIDASDGGTSFGSAAFGAPSYGAGAFGGNAFGGNFHR